MSPCESSRHLLEVETGSKSCPWVLSTGQALGAQSEVPKGQGSGFLIVRVQVLPSYVLVAEELMPLNCGVGEDS